MDEYPIFEIWKKCITYLAAHLDFANRKREDTRRRNGKRGDPKEWSTDAMIGCP